jgi:hypothetical protein
VNYITTHAPTPNGVLKNKLHYVFQFKDFEELRQKDMFIPDGLVINEDKKILIIPECKSGLAEEEDAEPRLVHQIETYSCKEFHSIIKKLIEYDQYEIVVFTFSYLVKELIQNLQGIRNDANIVIWTLEDEKFKKGVTIRKAYGQHVDNELDQLMSIGVSCEPPPREFIDPDMPEPRIAFVLGCRLLIAHGECLLKNNMVVKPSEFRIGNLDLVLSENKLRHFFRVLYKLVPSLCEYDKKTGNLVLERRFDAEQVSMRLTRIGSMSIPEYRKALGFPVEEEAYRKMVEKEIPKVLKPRRIPKLTEMWKEKKS